MFRAGQEEQLLLDVGRQVQQVHDLGHACTGDVAQPCQIGLIGYFALSDQPIETDRQGHEARDARHPPFWRRIRCGPLAKLTPFLGPPDVARFRFKHHLVEFRKANESDEIDVRVIIRD